MLHGGPAWRANGFARPPSSAQPDRGHVEQPGEGVVRRMVQQPLVKLERAKPETPKTPELERPAERETEVAAKKKQTRVRRGEEFQKEATRKVLADGKPGAAARVARELGVSGSVLARWVKMHGPALRGETKTLVSGAPKSKADPDRASQLLVHALGEFIRAVVDARVEEAMQERMKRLL